MQQDEQSAESGERRISAPAVQANGGDEAEAEGGDTHGDGPLRPPQLPQEESSRGYAQADIRIQAQALQQEIQHRQSQGNDQGDPDDPFHSFAWSRESRSFPVLTQAKTILPIRQAARCNPG